MKNLLIRLSGFAIGALLAIPLFVYATPSSVNRIVDHIQPLIQTDSIRAPFFTATSTTATSTFAGYVSIQGVTVATSTVMCTAGEGCQFQASGTADQVTCNAALAYLKGKGGGTLLIKKGNYSFSDRCYTDSGNITIEGEARGATVVTPAGNFSSPGTRGLFTIYNDGTAPVNNVTLKDITIDHNGTLTPGFIFRGNTSTATTSRNITVDNVEFKNRLGDRTGAIGSILIKGDYTGVVGSVKDVTIKNSYFHDNLPSGGIATTTYSIDVLDSSLDNFKVLNNKFENLYGVTISVGSLTAKGNSNWLFEGNSFVNTKLLEAANNTNAIDINDASRKGFSGINIVNNYWDDQTGTTFADEKFDIAVYNALSFTVDNNTFLNPRSVMAPGYTNPAGNEDIMLTFTNNKINNAISVFDPDGNYPAIYDHNIFYQIQHCPVLFDYGQHNPSRFSNNIFEDVCTNTETTIPYGNAVILNEIGGIISENNTFYTSTTTTTAPIYGFFEIYNPANDVNGIPFNTDANIYRNNSIQGFGVSVRGFALNDAFKHVIQNNYGFPETQILNINHNLTYLTATSTLPSTDVVSGNFNSGGLPSINNSLFGGTVGIGTTTPFFMLTVGTSTASQLSLSDLSSSPWNLRSINGNLYFATSSLTTFATSTIPSLTINSNGYLGLATSSPQQQLAVSGNAYFANNVGIGIQTVTSGANLHVVGTIAATIDASLPSVGKIRIRSGTDNDFLGLSRSGQGTTEVGLDSAAGFSIVDIDSSKTVLTLAHANKTNGQNLGLSTTSPFARLSVMGNANDTTFSPTLFAIGSSTASATTTLFLVNNIGNVGIGTTTPGSLLSLQGIANFTTGTTTFYGNGINIPSNQCYAVNGVCITSGAGSGTVTSIDASGGTTGLSFSGGPITSSGTLTLAGTLGLANGGTATTTGGVTNGIEFYNGTNLTNNGGFNYNGTNVSIATTTFNESLTVAGNIVIQNGSFLKFYNNANSRINTISIDSANNFNVKNGASGSMFIGTTANNRLEFQTNGVTVGSFQGNGKFGVGTTTPWGQISASSTNSYPALVIEELGTGPAAVIQGGNVGVSTTSPWRTLSIQGTVALNGLSAFAVGDSAICQRAGGEITVDSGVSSCIVSSQFVKHNITTIDQESATKRLMALTPVSFAYNDSGKQDLGLIAENVSKIDLRYAQYTDVPKDIDGHHFNIGDPTAINWSAITADLVKVVQGILNHQSEQDKKIADLEARIAILENEKLTMCTPI